MIENRRLSPRFLVLAASAAIASTAWSQRPTAGIEFKDRSAGIDYGAVRVGKHTIDALQPGSTWRMGFNEASVLKTEVPLLAGDTVVAPGSYRVAVHRGQEDAFSLALAEGARARSGSGDEFLKGALGKADKPNEKLAIDWTTPAKGKGEKDLIRESTVKVQFGAHLLAVPMTLVGARPAKVTGWTVDVFTIPSQILKERMEKGLLTPVATLKSGKDVKKAPASFNLFIGKDEASLVPAMEAPKEQFGFGPVTAPDDAWIRKAKVEIAQTKDSKPSLEATRLAKQGKDLSFLLAFGDQTVSFILPEPTGPTDVKSGKK